MLYSTTSPRKTRKEYTLNLGTLNKTNSDAVGEDQDSDDEDNDTKISGH